MRIRTILVSVLAVGVLAGCAPDSSPAPAPAPVSRATDTVRGTATFDVPRGWRATSDGDVVTMQPRIATTNQVSVTVSESRQAADDLETAARSTLDAAREDDGSARLGADRTFDDQRWFTVSSNVESSDGTTERLAYGTVTGGYRLVVELETVDADDSTALDARSTFRELMESVRLTS